MLDPRKPLHIRLGRILFRLPHNQQRWHYYLHQYLPVLQPAFKHNEAARLLILKLLRQIDGNHLKRADATIHALVPTVQESEDADKVLFSILRGMAELKAGYPDGAVRRFRWANRFNHRFYLPYMLVADHDAARLNYAQAVEKYHISIDCIYEYPPLTDTHRHTISIAYAQICYCHVMMHCYEEARTDLLHARQIEDENAHILHANAYLHAALEQKEAALACVHQFSEYDAKFGATLQEKIERILAKKDLHFTQQPVCSPEKIPAFWQRFLEREEELRRLLNNNGREAANTIFADLLREIDPYPDTDYGIDIFLKDNTYTLVFCCCYSCSYTPFVQDLIAACPAAIRERWHIECLP